MAIATITYSAKSDINTSATPDTNKVTANDMNEIKNIVNTNANLQGDLTTLNTTTKTSVVGAMNELYSGVIVDEGTGYIKFGNGVMICYGYVNGSSTLTDYWTYNKRTNDITITFPETFASAPAINLTPSSNGITGVVEINVTTTDCTCWVIKASATNDESYTVYYTAVGKWR